MIDRAQPKDRKLLAGGLVRVRQVGEKKITFDYLCPKPAVTGSKYCYVIDRR